MCKFVYIVMYSILLITTLSEEAVAVYIAYFHMSYILVCRGRAVGSVTVQLICYWSS